MNKENFKLIYENLKNKSIGKEKQSSSKRYLKKAIINISSITLMSTLLTACSIDSMSNNYTSNNNSEISSKQELKYYSGYEKENVEMYEKYKARDLLHSQGMDDYTKDLFRRNYNYTALDYTKVEGLDDSYLYSFYLLVEKENFYEVLKALGYESLDEYLIKNNYLDEYGNPSIEVWEEYNLDIAGKELSNGGRTK